MFCCDNGHTFINIIFCMEDTSEWAILYRGDFPNRFLLPLPLELWKSEIWDIALRAKSLTLGRVQAGLALLSLSWDIEILMFVIYCRCHF